MRKINSRRIVDKLVRENQGLVYHVMWVYFRHITPEHHLYDQILSYGNYILYRAARLFDKNEGVTFATYACRSIYKEIRRELHRYKVQFQFSEKVQITYKDKGFSRVELKESCEILLSTLDERSRFIVEQRMEGKDLREVGNAIGFSGERVRQLQNEAFKVMRQKAIETRMVEMEGEKVIF